MIDSKIQASIMDKENELELSNFSQIIIPFQAHNKILNLKPNSSAFNPYYVTPLIINFTTATPNFKIDVAAWCFGTIVKDHDLNAARARIKRIEWKVNCYNKS